MSCPECGRTDAKAGAAWGCRACLARFASGSRWWLLLAALLVVGCEQPIQDGCADRIVMGTFDVSCRPDQRLRVLAQRAYSSDVVCECIRPALDGGKRQ